MGWVNVNLVNIKEDIFTNVSCNSLPRTEPVTVRPNVPNPDSYVPDRKKLASGETIVIFFQPYRILFCFVLSN